MQVPGPRPFPTLLAFTVLSIVMTWPLAVHLGDRVPAGSNDLWQNYWNFWWWKTAILERGASPFETDMIFFPQKTSLAFHTHSAGNILLTSPLLALFGPGVALNVATIAGFVLAGWAAYLLVREVVGDGRAGFVAGIIFAFFPQHFEQSLEHINLASYGTMPLFLYFLVRGIRRGGWGSWIGAGLSFALNTLFSFHGSLMILPGAAVVFLAGLWRTERPRQRVLIETAVAGVVATVVVLPFIWPLLAGMAEGGSSLKPPVRKPIDLAFLLVPAREHTLWGGLASPIHDAARRYPSAGFTGYLGIVAVVLAGIGVVATLRRRGLDEEIRPGRTALFWGAWFVIYLVFALGSELLVAGKDAGVPLPFRWLRSLPLYGSLRVANRFLVPAMIGLSVLAALGSAAWLRTSKRPRTVLVAIVALLVLDFLWLPFPTRELPRPRWLDGLATAPEGAVLNIPGGYRARAAIDMYLQTIHRRPIAGGYVSVTPEHVKELIDRHPFLISIFEGRPKEDVPATIGLEPLLDEIGVTVVALHLGRTREAYERKQQELRGTVAVRFFNPEKVIPQKKLDEVRAELRQLCGVPFWADAEVELYSRRTTP